MNTSDVLNRLTYHRRSQAGLVQFLRIHEPDLADLVHGCGSWLHVREWIESGESRLRNANFCKRFLLCQSCAARRSSKMVAAYTQKVQLVMPAWEEANGSKLIPVHLVLSLKTGPDLGERFLHLKESCKRMVAAARKGKSNSGRHQAIEWNKVAGCVRSFEVKRSEEVPTHWQPHIHVFALLTEYMDYKKLSAEWEGFTGDSKVVWVNKCYGVGVVPGLIETLKYVCKLSELSNPDILHVFRTAKGSRFTDAQGILRGVPEPEIDQDDTTGLTGAYREFYAIWGARMAYNFYPLATAAEPAEPLVWDIVSAPQPSGESTSENRYSP